MYQNRQKNIAIMIASIVMGLFFFISIRQQVMIEDRNFLRSMIPHHGGAILMCEEAELSDPKVKALCESIIENQQTEIDQMKAMLREIEG